VPKKLLIVTGPQGSGNHLFSRVLSLHHEVNGWKSLLDEYWVPSDQETFAPYWLNPQDITEETFASHDFHLANVSCPFFFDGARRVPKIIEVAERAESLGIDVSVAIIVRDQGINELQQQRVRQEVTLPIAQEYYYENLIPSHFDVHFLDHEALFLHGKHYMRWVSQLLNFPIAYDHPDLMKFIAERPNQKYVKYVDEYWLDEQVWNGCKRFEDRGIF
jgi:hypothetical protein